MTAPKRCSTAIALANSPADLLRHTRVCPICQLHAQAGKPACSDPALGLLATMCLGANDLLPDLRLHLDTCLACRLEQLAFASLDDEAISPRVAWVSKLRLAIDNG